MSSFFYWQQRLPLLLGLTDPATFQPSSETDTVSENTETNAWKATEKTLNFSSTQTTKLPNSSPK